MNKSAPISRTAELDWRKIACRPAPPSKMFSRGMSSMPAGALPEKVFDAWAAGAGERGSRRGHAGGGHRQPLDPGRGRGQGAASLLQIGGQTSHLSGSPPRQEPAHRRGMRRGAGPCHHHQLPDPRAHREVAGAAKQLRLRGAGAAFAGTGHRFASGADGAGLAFYVGGNAAASSGRTGAESAARACAPR